MAQQNLGPRCIWMENQCCKGRNGNCSNFETLKKLPEDPNRYAILNYPFEQGQDIYVTIGVTVI